MKIATKVPPKTAPAMAQTISRIPGSRPFALIETAPSTMVRKANTTPPHPSKTTVSAPSASRAPPSPPASRVNSAAPTAKMPATSATIPPAFRISQFPSASSSEKPAAHPFRARCAVATLDSRIAVLCRRCSVYSCRPCAGSEFTNASRTANLAGFLSSLLKISVTERPRGRGFGETPFSCARSEFCTSQCSAPRPPQCLGASVGQQARDRTRNRLPPTPFRT